MAKTSTSEAQWFFAPLDCGPPVHHYLGTWLPRRGLVAGDRRNGRQWPQLPLRV